MVRDTDQGEDQMKGMTDIPKEDSLHLDIDPRVEETTPEQTMLDLQAETLDSTLGKSTGTTPEWKGETVTLAMVGGAEDAARRP